MNSVVKVILIVIGIIVLLIGSFAIYLTYGLKKGLNVQINDIDLSAVRDGEYTGVYNSGRWSNKVNVTVKDHKITGIKYIKDVVFSMKPVQDKVISDVEEKQSLKIDAISGATVTSKAYLKSIENALNHK